LVSQDICNPLDTVYSIPIAFVMEFLDIILIKGSSLSLHALRSPFYWRF
jgi:hypothetical protein